jgi:ribonuclease HI
MPDIHEGGDQGNEPQEKTPPLVTIFTDGACLGNPSPGGWGAVLVHPKKRITLSGGFRQTTNNRMEMTAAIEALKTLKFSCQVVMTTDSQYLKNGITQWMKGWKRNGWVTAAKTPVKNRDLWMELDRQLGRHEVRWEWVKGHAGHKENEEADQLAGKAARSPNLPKDEGYLRQK